jgi:hypothetical protein
VAGTLVTLLYEIRRLLGDRRPGDPVCGDAFLEELTDIAIEELSDEIGQGQLKTVGFQALTVGVATYAVALPSSIPSILHLQSLVLESMLGYPLERVSLENLLAMRVTTNQATGTPLYYCLREDNAQAVYLEIHPAPTAADAVTAYWEPVHKRVQSGGASGTTTALSFAKPALTVLRMRVAGKAVAALTDEMLGKLNPPKSRQFGQDLLAQSVNLAQMEGFRLHAGTLPDLVERTR